MAFLKPHCAAKSSFCGQLKLKKLIIRDGPKLDDRADQEIWPQLSKNQQAKLNREAGIELPKRNKKTKVIFLEGGGQVNVSVVQSIDTLLGHDYPELVFFDPGKKKLGLISIPTKIIPKHAFDLFPEQLEKAKEELKKAQEAAGDHQDMLTMLKKKIKQLEHDNKGDIPEKVAGEAIGIVFYDSEG